MIKVNSMSYTLSFDSRIQAFVELGKTFGSAVEWLRTNDLASADGSAALYESVQKAGIHNPWFTKKNILFALNAWQHELSEQSLRSWLQQYEGQLNPVQSKKVAVIMAGNIPLVGFHDFVCTLISGHHFIGKLSADDNILLPALADALCCIEPGFKEKILFTQNTLKDFDVIIATGSNNSARYFEYYFSKYPHIIRNNRNGVAVLSGNESDEDIKKLGSDICLYFGLGCRNVSKVFIPEGYLVENIFQASEPFANELCDHYKYMNNYSYRRSLYLLNNTPHKDNGIMILTESEQYSSPISVIFYEYYRSLDELDKKLANDDRHIQCIATGELKSSKSVQYGKTQLPGLSDYADGIDTIQFLTEL